MNKTHNFLIAGCKNEFNEARDMHSGETMKQNKIFRIVTTSLATLALSAVVFAQAGPPQGGPGGQRGPGNQGPQAGPRQGGPGGPNQMQRRGPGAGMMLVRMSSVQKELEMTADQIKQVNEMRPMMGGPGGQGGPGGPPPQGGGFGAPPGGGQGQPPRGGGQPPAGQGGPPQGGGFGQPPQAGQGRPGGPPQGGGFGQRQGGPDQAMNNPLDDILSQKQMKRLHQLELQFNAPMTLMQPELNREMKFSEDQRMEIDDIIKKAGLGFRGPGQGGPGFGGPGGPPQGGQGGGFGAPPQGGPPQGGGQGRPGGPPQGGFGQGGPQVNFGEMQAKKADAMKKVMGILTSEQKDLWRKITGAEFNKWEEPKRPNADK